MTVLSLWSDNERDSSLLNSSGIKRVTGNFLKGHVAFSHTIFGKDRSVMFFSILGHLHTLLNGSTCLFPCMRGLGNPHHLTYPLIGWSLGHQ